MKDVIIIGQGPAGISAALYTCRAKLSTTIIGKDGGSLARADKIENYFGLAEPLSGRELLSIGKTQSMALGAELIEDEVLHVAWEDGHFAIDTVSEKLESKTVILATGAPRKVPKIKGIEDFEGRGVSYCAVCDAFFFRGRNVAVLGNSLYALHEIQHLLPIVNSVTLLTNGASLDVDLKDTNLKIKGSGDQSAEDKSDENKGTENQRDERIEDSKRSENVEINVITEPIAELTGDDFLQEVSFKKGQSLAVDGLFVALGSASAIDLARKLGANVQDGAIIVSNNMITNVPGFFAAGDCTGGLSQVSTAVAEGAKAAMSAIEYIRHPK